jgi:hypothetical protein
MTEDTIKEHRAIAEFMGYSIHEGAYGDAIKDKTSYRLLKNGQVVNYLGLVNGRSIDDAWVMALKTLSDINTPNFLIEVIEKIEHLKDCHIFVEICGYRTEISQMINHNWPEDKYTIAEFGGKQVKNKQESMYKAVVKFLEWYMPWGSCEVHQLIEA